MISFKFDKAKLAMIMKLPMKAGKLAFKYTAEEAWSLLMKESPVDHGRLAGSWQLSKENDFRYKAKSGVKYALAVATGTGIYGPEGRPIIIEPVTKKCLHFIWQGMEIFTKRAEVQGMKPNPYPDRAMKGAEKRVPEFIKRALREVDTGAK